MLRCTPVFAGLGLTLLAGCALGPAEPREVRLTNDLLRVTMSDNTICRGPAPETGAETGWSGQLEDCAWEYPYEVAITPDTNPLRFAFEETLGRLAPNVLTPIATVTITEPTGRLRSFETRDIVAEDEDDR